jgi:hypothetical protein
MQTVAARLRTRILANAAAPPVPAPEVYPTPVDQRVIEQLRALGYTRGY